MLCYVIESVRCVKIKSSAEMKNSMDNRKKAADNLILILLGCSMLFQKQNPDPVHPVVVLLSGVSMTALCIYITEKKWFAAVGVIYAAGCFFLPELTVFLPVIFYYGGRYRFPWAAVCAAPFLTAVWNGEYQGTDIFLWLVCCAFSLLMACRTRQSENLEAELIQMRDTGTELSLVLQEKNRNLREKQDSEIYLATLRERNRIAREIHDNVGHMLSRSILQVGALGTVHGEEPLHGQLTAINGTLNQAMNSIRESVHDLRDDSIDLRQAVADAIRFMQESYTVHVDYDMSKAVPAQVKYCFIATVKEAMANVVKHSDGDKIEIVLREHPGFYQLFIGDNGTRRAKKGSDGMGLQNMRDRVKALNGLISVNDEKGFQIMISIGKSQTKEMRSEKG